MKHSYNLDSLRGLLSLVVVMQHTATAFIYSIDGVASPVNTYLGLAAHYSVLFFFALSGYVITLSITENKKRNGAFNLTEYIISRLLRILPPLMGAFLLSFILLLILTHLNAIQVTGNFKYFIRKIYDPDIAAQLKAIFSLMVSGDLGGGANNVNGALWSLVYEIQFYVFAGLLSVIIMAKKLGFRILCFLLLALYSYGINIKFELNIQWVSYICFASGSVAYLFKDAIVRSKFILPFITIALICAIGIQTEWSNIIQKLRTTVPASGEWMIYRAIMGVFFAVLLIHLDKVGKLLSVFHKISPYSYSLYITHFPIVVFIWFIFVNHAPKALNHYYVLSVATVIVCMLVAWWFARILEKPKQQRAFVYRLIKFRG